MSGPLPLITLPDFETLVIDRLYACCSEINELTSAKMSVFKMSPSFALNPSQFPACFSFVGAMTTPTPIEQIGSGVNTRVRDYVIRILGDPYGSTIDNNATEGAQGPINLLPYFNAMYSYFLGHPSLQTTALDSLRYIAEQILMSDSGFVIRPAPGGADHFAIDFTLTITMRAQISTLA